MLTLDRIRHHRRVCTGAGEPLRRSAGCVNRRIPGRGIEGPEPCPLGEQPTDLRAFFRGGRDDEQMARGRMICRELAGSEKFYALSSDAKWIYQLATAFTDRDGFLPASGRELSTLFLGGLIPSWDEIDAVASEIEGAELWHRFTDARGRVCLYVVKFHEHQDLRSYLFEAISVYELPLTGEHEPPTLRDDRDTQKKPGGVIVTRDGSRTREPGAGAGSGTREREPDPGAGRKEKTSKEKLSKEKAREEGTPTRKSRDPMAEILSPGEDTRKTATRSDIIQAYRDAYEAELETPCYLKPKDPREAEQAAEMGCFPAGRDLVEPFRAAIRKLSKGDYTVSLRSVVNNADLDGKARAKIRDETPAAGGPVYEDLTKMREELLAEFGGDGDGD